MHFKIIIFILEVSSVSTDNSLELFLLVYLELLFLLVYLELLVLLVYLELFLILFAVVLCQNF